MLAEYNFTLTCEGHFDLLLLQNVIIKSKTVRNTGLNTALNTALLIGLENQGNNLVVQCI
jgi:hypothetical protein